MKPKYVGLTAVTISISNAAELAKRLRAKNPDIQIIIGGPHITAVPNETIERLGFFFDIAVIGEGDIVILELLDALKNNKPLSEIKGIAYASKDNTLIINERKEFIKDLDKLPLPAWDLLPDLGKYYRPPVHTIKKFPVALLMSSRGCPGLCTFCDNEVFGRRLRCHSSDYVIKMIKNLQKHYGIKEIQFRDDNFMVFKTRTIELCKKIIEQNIDITWSCTGRVDMITPEMLGLMKRAGCWQIWYGVESGSDRILKFVKKNTTQEKIAKAVIDTKKAGISPCGFFMIGFPTETEEEIKQTIKTALELPFDGFNMSHMAPFPGSEMSLTIGQYGNVDSDWKKMTGWKTLFVPKDVSRERLVHYSNLAFKKFYLRPRIIFHYFKMIRSFYHLKMYLIAAIGFLAMVTQKKRD